MREGRSLLRKLRGPYVIPRPDIPRQMAVAKDPAYPAICRRHLFTASLTYHRSFIDSSGMAKLGFCKS